ncbi:DUF938 domain-containing protein [Qipengyuania aquimaris]|uniref:DUF938 domain-containing protein n=1 Tax=Qipengyuania aquimaris TaxID=255984 RepID=UPI001CD751F5|nr:DUF938 domain-containing protein [Qipengyuania aquimaris]MCA0904169.1 class I SAM-dependent methyltransferase [Qipengyuania aquimaris]
MKRHAPATARNSGALAQVLGQELPDTGRVLEIASGSGEHALFMARRFTTLVWQPSDIDPEALASIDAWSSEAGLQNLERAIALDAADPVWCMDSVDAILCVNMIHISPIAATVGLFAGAAKTLASGAPLILYGPFFEEDTVTAPSNIAFDESLRERNSEWGLRQVGWLDTLAGKNGLSRSARHEMPANNLVLVYRKA